MIIEVIIQEPEVAILDEIFAGMDRGNIQNAQKMLTKHLPDTKFLIVDHEAATHNETGWYKQNLHIANKTLHLRALPPMQEDGDPAVSDADDSQVAIMPAGSEGVCVLVHQDFTCSAH